ncbi:MAG: DUF2207 domain-containing protein [Thermoanaerobaculia bacterium]
MKLKIAVGIALLASAFPLPASARTLHWRSMEVRARLDGDGVLHVLERQNMIFDGDWNGGERRFRLGPGQELALASITRIDPATGETTPLVEGSLLRVDGYSFVGAKTLRWRSRLPSDPPFSNREIDYVLDYTLSGILEKHGETYRLNHDFAFPDRDGPIDRFTLDLSLDPSWTTAGPLAMHQEAGPLPPGRGYVVSASLHSTRPVAPEAVRTIPLLADRGLAKLLIAVAVLLFGVHYWLHDRARGRFKPLPPLSDVDGAWLKENVFDLLPEEVGTAIDDDVGSPEVAAVLARLVAEGKLRSETTSESGKATLHLTRMAPDRDLHGYELSLVDGLFFGEKSVTPEDVRAHYKSSGFSPAKLIEKDLKARLAAKGPFADTFKPPAAWRTLVFFLAGAALGIATLFHSTETDPRALFIFLFASAFCAGLGTLISRGAAESFRPFNAPLLFSLALVLVPWIIVGLALPADYSPTLFAAFTMLTVMYVSSVFHRAMSRDGAARMERRRRLATARRFFQEQLESAHPKLEDAWFPYLLALGLGSGVEKWSKAFAGSSGALGGSSSFGSSSFGSSSSGSGSGGGWTGGGGSFGGAGASAGWAAAVGGFSAGVAAPSSSGGGGGGSSGGGGGGGW